MRQTEADLGTKLDWLAVNHFNTGHPHVHVIVNGRDDQREDLVVNGDYIAHGTLVPWSPVIDRQLGQEVMGVVKGGSVSWQLGRGRGLAPWFLRFGHP
jgi:hypothetical protein